jgi:hypothetical protein
VVKNSPQVLQSESSCLDLKEFTNSLKEMIKSFEVQTEDITNPAALNDNCSTPPSWQYKLTAELGATPQVLESPWNDASAANTSAAAVCISHLPESTSQKLFSLAARWCATLCTDPEPTPASP